MYVLASVGSSISALIIAALVVAGFLVATRHMTGEKTPSRRRQAADASYTARRDERRHAVTSAWEKFTPCPNCQRNEHRAADGELLTDEALERRCAEAASAADKRFRDENPDASSAIAASTPASMLAFVEDGAVRTCRTCGLTGRSCCVPRWAYSPNGDEAYCAEHWPRFSTGKPRPAGFA